MLSFARITSLTETQHRLEMATIAAVRSRTRVLVPPVLPLSGASSFRLTPRSVPPHLQTSQTSSEAIYSWL